ncbi:MAG TPA: ABC transporter permease [Candidatus Limnocylindrales bacterium]|nr:ABC transporter permease [Candidatus Limnocylindrales bacterium]
MILLQVLTRLLAIVGKELVEAIRRPAALFSLVLGPFLIMAIFGLGYDNSITPFRADLVVPPGAGLSTNLADYQPFVPPGARLDSVGTDAAAAEQALRNQAVDVVVYVPANLMKTFEAGQQSTIRVEYNLISPAKADYATLLVQQLAYAVNEQIIERTAGTGVSVLRAPGSSFPIPPAVIAAPTRAQPENIAPNQPSLPSFYGPAVLALILQHLAITLTALSLIRERRTGVFDVLRVSPVSAFEIVLGKVVAFAILGVVIALALLAVLVDVLGVPLLGDPLLIAASVGLLLVASLGLGLLISVVSDSDRQAVQLALMSLLASVFFSGFLLDVQQFVPVVQGLGDLLPATHGIRLLQDLMLRGAPPSRGTSSPWRRWQAWP